MVRAATSLLLLAVLVPQYQRQHAELWINYGDRAPIKQIMVFLAAVLLMGCSGSAPGLISAQSGVSIDAPKWFVVDGIDEGAWCTAASQATAAGGVLTLTAVYGSFNCQGHTRNYKVGALMSAPFSFTYGTVRVVAKMAPTGVHSTIWLWGGAPGTSGYPPTCIAAIRAGGAYMGACTADGSNAYEIDVAELMPRDQGVTKISNSTQTWRNGEAINKRSLHYDTLVDLSADFHTYELDWSPTQLVYKMDGVVTGTLPVVKGTFDQPMFILLDQETDYLAGYAPAETYPLNTQIKSVKVWDQSDRLIFSDFFNGNLGGSQSIP